jgi:hypothetical protein
MSREIFGYCIKIACHPYNHVMDMQNRKIYQKWLKENITKGNYYYSKRNAFYHIIEFGDREDVTAFLLKFNCNAERSLSRLEKMLIHEDAIERMIKNDRN